MQTAEIIRDDSLRELIPHKTGGPPSGTMKTT